MASMARTQVVTVGILVGAVLLAGYSNNVLQVEIESMNQSLHAAQQTMSTRVKELMECTNLLNDRKDHIKGVESDKKLLTVNLTNLEQQFNTVKTRADSLRISEKENEVQELKAKVKTAQASHKKEREKLDKLQDALDKLAKEEEAKNAAMAKKVGETQKESKVADPPKKEVKSEEAQKKGNAPAAPEKEAKSDGKKQ